MVNNTSVGQVLCSYNQCKLIVISQWWATKGHVKEWGIWNENIMENQIWSHASTRLVDVLKIKPSTFFRINIWLTG